MKKIGFLLLILGLFCFVGTNAFAGNCREVEFANGLRVCVNIEKKSSNIFKLNTKIEKGNGDLRCGVYLESMDGAKQLSSCNDDFLVNNIKEQQIIIYIGNGSQQPTNRVGKPNNEWVYPQRMYDFNIGERSNLLGNNNNNNDNNGNNNNNNNYNVNNFYITTNKTSPDTYQRVDLSIKARNYNNSTVTDYRGTVRFEVYYRSSSNSSWNKTTSSNYFELKSSYDNTYNFSSYDNGYVTLSNAIRFNRNYEYKVLVLDNNNSSIYGEQIFYVGDNNNNNNNNYNVNNFYITTNKTSPDTYQRVDLSIKARNYNNSTVTDYRGTVRFEVYYRSSSNSSWNKTTSSNYFELKSSYDNTYNFSSYDNGYVTLSNAIRFNRNYEYKVLVLDNNNSSIYGEQIFYVGDNNNNNNNNYNVNNFYITTNKTSPDTYQRVDLSIKARNYNNSTVTDYRGTVRFEVYYRSSSNSSWNKTTSSNYFELKSSYDNTYNFSSYDNGYVTLSNAIRFNRNYEYKVLVLDNNNSSIYGEQIFYVGDNSSGIYGFTNTEITNMRKVYNVRDDLIKSLKKASSSLRYNQTRNDLSEDLKSEMKKILDNNSYKKYKTYKEFGDAFNYRYSYTLRYK